MGPLSTGALSQEGVISPDGSCKTFDASANGYARAEAINAIFIKRLSDAERDKNPIRAIIRNTGTNSDGRGQGLVTPHGKAQEALMRKVYFDCGLDPRDTAYVEVSLNISSQLSTLMMPSLKFVYVVSWNWYANRRSYRSYRRRECIWRTRGADRSCESTQYPLSHSGQN